jgi:hypothetical protein
MKDFHTMTHSLLNTSPVHVGDIVRVRTSHASTILAVVIAEETNGPHRPGQWFGFAANGYAEWLQASAIVERDPLCLRCGTRGRFLRSPDATITYAICGPRLNWADAWQVVLSNAEALKRDPTKRRVVREAIATCDVAFECGDAVAFQRAAMQL